MLMLLNDHAMVRY